MQQDEAGGASKLQSYIKGLKRCLLYEMFIFEAGRSCIKAC